jgi:hypothetical protein
MDETTVHNHFMSEGMCVVLQVTGAQPADAWQLLANSSEDLVIDGEIDVFEVPLLHQVVSHQLLGICQEVVRRLPAQLPLGLIAGCEEVHRPAAGCTMVGEGLTSR